MVGLGKLHRLWFHAVYLPDQIAEFISCREHSLYRSFVEFLRARGIDRSCSDYGVKCPFCGFTFSRKGFKNHLLKAHYSEVLQLIDEYYKLRELVGK